jgi:beta-galactosidase
VREEIKIMDGWEFYLDKTGLAVKALEQLPKKDFQPVHLPHDWAMEQGFDLKMEEGMSAGFRNRYGIGWYKRTLSLPEKRPDSLYFLRFGGIYENSTVWVNGECAGGRKYGYSSFELDITAFLTEGDNEIIVKADNTERPSDRWYSGAGIYRTVTFVRVNRNHLDPRQVVVKTALVSREEARVTARVTVDAGLGENGKVTAQLAPVGAAGAGEEQPTDVSGMQSCNAGGGQPLAVNAGAPLPLYAQAGDGSGKLEFLVEDARLWSGEEPNRYELTLSLWEEDDKVDELSLLIGIREVSVSPDTGLFVNGQPVKLKGVCLHQDVGSLGIAATKELWRERLNALRELGCNAIRAAHHTYAEEFLDLCDEMGFYVYEECFDKWHGGLYGRYFDTEWQADVDAMVKRDRNRPSILFWGVGNEVENQAQEGMLNTLSLLSDYVRGLDDTRPVSYAMNPHFKRETKVDLSKVTDIQAFVDEAGDTDITDNRERVEQIAKIARYVDIISCNYQEQWYDMIHERIPDKAILGTEIYQYFCGAPDQLQNFTEENPSLIAQRLPYVIGGFIWTGIDYLGESMGEPAKGWSGSLIRTNGSRRPSFYQLQSYWSREPMVHFSVMDYSLSDEGGKEHWDIPMLADHWDFPQFCRTVIPYRIVSNCEEVELYLNEKRIYVKPPAEYENRVITGFLPWKPGKVCVIGKQNGREVCRQETVTSGTAVRLAFQPDAWCEKKKSDRLPAERGYHVLLTAEAQDAAGHFCFRENGRVRFFVEGPAEIVRVDNGDMMGSEDCMGTSIHLYRGRASVMLRLTGEEGRIRVSACADGMRPGEKTLACGR